MEVNITDNNNCLVASLKIDDNGNIEAILKNGFNIKTNGVIDINKEA